MKRYIAPCAFFMAPLRPLSWTQVDIGTSKPKARTKIASTQPRRSKGIGRACAGGAAEGFSGGADTRVIGSSKGTGNESSRGSFAAHCTGECGGEQAPFLPNSCA